MSKTINVFLGEIELSVAAGRMYSILLVLKELVLVLVISRSKALPDAVKHYVAKLVKSFGRLGAPAESLDDFRYAIGCF